MRKQERRPNGDGVVLLGGEQPVPTESDENLQQTGAPNERSHGQMHFDFDGGKHEKRETFDSARVNSSPIRYPNHPGSKGQDGTSQEAARSMAGAAARLRMTALRTLDNLGEATEAEAAVAAKCSRDSLQPRFSELRAMRMVEPTGGRRRNPSGRFAAILRLTETGWKELQNSSPSVE